VRSTTGFRKLERSCIVDSWECFPRHVTIRKSSYRSLASLQRDQRRCRACTEAGFPLESLPVWVPYTGQPAYLFGQAPGIVEGQERRPWRGRAGQALRRWLAMDEETFYGTFYCASVTRCYPGRAASGRGDRTPAPLEQRLCAFWRDWELRLLHPRLVVTVGGLAARRLLGATSLDCIGGRFEQDDRVVVPLPHPSGASGWLNVPANRERLAQALSLVHEELRSLAPGER
jgi:uracil-DNA glycosylase